MYARGMSTREIVGHLHELYGIDVSPDLISAVTDAVLEEVAAWQARPLEAIYPLVFFDALRSRSATKAWCATGRSTSRLQPLYSRLKAEENEGCTEVWERAE